MANDDKIIDEKLQYDINKEANKISALSSVTIDKYESSRWRRITSWSKKSDWTNWLYLFFFRKTFGKINKKDWRSREQQTKAIEKHGKQLVESNEIQYQQK